ALVTVHAAPRGPADADALSDRETFCTRSDRRDPTDDLVSKDRGILRKGPVIIQDGEIGVTHTAVFDRDFNVLGPERSEIKGFPHHRLFRRLRDPGLILPHVSFFDTGIGLKGGLGWSGHGGSFLRGSVCVDRTYPRCAHEDDE